MNYPPLTKLCNSCDANCCNGELFDTVHIFPSEKSIVKKLSKLGAKFTQTDNGWIMNVEGGCPFLINNRCSIYKFRPKTCRYFDCRDNPNLMYSIHGM